MTKINTPLDHDPLMPDRTEKNIPDSTYKTLIGRQYNYNKQERDKIDADSQR